jgi:hypothetical protein
LAEAVVVLAEVLHLIAMVKMAALAAVVVRSIVLMLLFRFLGELEQVLAQLAALVVLVLELACLHRGLLVGVVVLA